MKGHTFSVKLAELAGMSAKSLDTRCRRLLEEAGSIKPGDGLAALTVKPVDAALILLSLGAQSASNGFEIALKAAELHVFGAEGGELHRIGIPHKDGGPPMSLAVLLALLIDRGVNEHSRHRAIRSLRISSDGEFAELWGRDADGLFRIMFWPRSRFASHAHAPRDVKVASFEEFTDLGHAVYSLELKPLFLDRVSRMVAEGTKGGWVGDLANEDGPGPEDARSILGGLASSATEAMEALGELADLEDMVKA